MQSRTLRILVMVVGMVVLFTSAALAQGPSTVQMAAQNNSGQTGTTTMTARGDQTEVVINVSAGQAGVDQPAHIHTGTCAAPGPVVFPLSPVKEGKSTTLVNAKLADIANGQHIVNVHKSAQEVSVYTSCGAIQQVAATAASPATLPTTGSGDTMGIWVAIALGMVMLITGLLLPSARRR